MSEPGGVSGAPALPTVSPERLKGIGLVLTSGCCWGFHGILIKFALGMGVSFIQIFLFEVLFATVFFAFFWRRFLHPVRPSGWRQWGRLLTIGISTIGVGSLLFLSFSLGPVSIAATLMFLYLPVVYLLSVALGRQKVNGAKISAIALILVGAALTTRILQSFGEPGVWGAILAAVGASACYAVVFMLTPAVAAYTTLSFRSFTVSAVGLLGCAVILLFVPELWYGLGENPLKLVLLALVLGVVGQTLPVITLMKGLPLTGGSLGGVLASVELPIAVFTSALVLGESLTVGKAAGVLLVLGGIILYNFSDAHD